MNLTNSQPFVAGGNALSEQPAHIREAILAQLNTSSTPRPPGSQSPLSKGMSAPVSGEARAFDPRLVAAVTTIVETLLGLVTNRSGVGARDLDRGEMKRDYVLGPGAIEYFPTWSFWGRTFVRMINTGTLPTVVMINEDRFHLNPGEQTDKDGQWAAFPIRVVNTIELPGSQVTVRVW